MLSTGARQPRCTLCGAGADVHCHADAAFLCAPCDAQVHGANSLASRHRRTRVPPEPSHVRAEVSATTMGLDPWAARLGAVAAHRPPEPNHVRADVSARAMGLDHWAARLRATTAASTHVPPEPNHARTEVSANAMGLDPGVARLHAATAGRTRVSPPSDARGRCRAELQLLPRRIGLDEGATRLRAAGAFRTLRGEFAAAAPRIPLPLRVPMAAALWREVAAHGGVHEPGKALQRLAAWAHVPASSLVTVAIGRARQVRTAIVDVGEDTVDCAIVSPRQTPQELNLFI
ncbi:hypothetical protein VPH35_084784 [Triticum aestivum]